MSIIDPEVRQDDALPAHVYLHVPFCASKCSYCDFTSVVDADPQAVHAVFRGMRSQLTGWHRTGLEGVIETVYFGGGTPSLHHGQVIETLGHLRDLFPVHAGAEITVEANPDSLDERVIEELVSAGVNRISVGVQSFDDRALRMLGRRHDARAAWDACLAVARAGVDLSVDLMCGIPGQSASSWGETLERATATGTYHVSVYPLSLEPGTALEVAVSGGLVEGVDPDVAADMMIQAEATLGYHGLGRYEVANYAEDRAHESRHNTAYWTGRSYLGIGPAAHGMLDAATARAAGLIDSAEVIARVRYANADDLDAWFAGRDDTIESLTFDEALREDVMLGLRLVRGVAQSRVEAASLGAVMESLAHQGLVERATGPDGDGVWRTTRRGWLLGNEVFSRVWAGE
jgi:oxygen-independent coproporphyrinogen-3 oxidase